MRLIDGDNIRGCANYIEINEDFEPYIMIDDLVKLLDEQPTAYSVDKVVEELESEKRYGSKYDSYYEENLYRGEMFENDVNNKTIDKAIKIVKQGGASDDVCEWKAKSNYYVTKCSHDTDVMYGLKQEFKFCPYCGKKIKVVE